MPQKVRRWDFAFISRVESTGISASSDDGPEADSVKLSPVEPPFPADFVHFRILSRLRCRMIAALFQGPIPHCGSLPRSP